MILYRIVRDTYADDLSGTGARLYGGRWNSKGKSMLYTASTPSLALLEVLVHLSPLMVPKNYFSVQIEVPDDSVLHLPIKALPDNWNDILPPLSLKKIGDNFLADMRYLLLKVPSAVVPMEYNYLINTQHPAIKKVRIVKKQPFNFDRRLID